MMDENQFKTLLKKSIDEKKTLFSATSEKKLQEKVGETLTMRMVTDRPRSRFTISFGPKMRYALSLILVLLSGVLFYYAFKK